MITNVSVDAEQASICSSRPKVDTDVMNQADTVNTQCM